MKRDYMMLTYKMAIENNAVLKRLEKKLEGNGKPGYFSLVDNLIVEVGKLKDFLREMIKTCSAKHSELDIRIAKKNIDALKEIEMSKKQKKKMITTEDLEHGIKDFAHLCQVAKANAMGIATSIIAIVAAVAFITTEIINYAHKVGWLK